MQATRSPRDPTRIDPLPPAARAVLDTTRRAWLGAPSPLAASSAVSPPAPGIVGDTIARHRRAAARLVARVYRSANQRLRADMLVCLLRPLGPLSLVGVASGAFAALLQQHGSAPDWLSLDAVARFSSDQILELAAFVHEVNPGAIEQLAALLAQNPMALTALSASALVLLYRRLRPAPVPLSVGRP